MGASGLRGSGGLFRVESRRDPASEGAVWLIIVQVCDRYGGFRPPGGETQLGKFRRFQHAGHSFDIEGPLYKVIQAFW